MATTIRARRFLGLLYLMLLMLMLASLYLDLRGLGGQYRNLAAEVGRSFFRSIDAMREWNLKHGGLYIRVAGDTLPNPHLPDSLREVTTTGGVRLAMINHAHMTRLLSELLSHQEGIRLHITSLSPLRPDNRPDAWEQQALKHLEQGRPEEYAVLADESGSAFRYMAPLRAQTICVSCHPGQEQEEDSHKVRGGITVSFSYAPFLEAEARDRKRILFAHALFFVLGLGLISLTGSKLVQSVDALQDSLLHIKRLEGFLPICAKCKKIRLEGAESSKQESWIAIESYIQKRTDAQFSHGLCPVCTAQLYPEFANRKSRP